MKDTDNLKYYLETNSLRNLGSKVIELNNDCYTSGLAIFEIVSGINDSDFDIRKSVIEKTLNSKMGIIWELPETIMARAFPPFDYIDNRVDGLKYLCSQLIKSNSYNDFIENTKDKKYNSDYFRNLDKHYSTHFITATEKGNKNLKLEKEKAKNHEYGEIISAFANDFIDKLPENLIINESITIYAMSENVVDGLKMSFAGKKFNREKVYNNYNGVLMIFVKAFSLYTALKSKYSNLPARNDFIDLHHLMYLFNDSNKQIVTDDNMIKKINKQTITIKDFKNIYT